MKFYLVYGLAAALTATASMGQTQGQSAPGGAQAGSTAPSKVGILNVRQAIVNSAEGKQASAELQSQFAARQTELENLRKQIEDLQNRARTGERLSDEERNRLGRQLDQFTRLYRRKEEDLREDLASAEQEVVDRIGSKMMDVVDRYARENAYAVVLDVSGQGPVIYASNQVDITQDIIRLYDQAHPVTGAAPQPGQARPQPGQTRPPQPQQNPPKPPQN